MANRWIKLDSWKANLCDGSSIIVYTDNEMNFKIKSPRHDDVIITKQEILSCPSDEDWTHDWTDLFMGKSDEGNYYDNDRITEVVEDYWNDSSSYLYHKIMSL